jgi:DNA helicase-2/ATP-dependent DNA helicase PcrA
MATPVVIDRDTFFELVDEVLIAVGRVPLTKGSPQRSIIDVRPDDRVLQILAGAGSGKTEMLVWRVLYELFVLGTPARRLLVTTFTRKAATELELRVVERSDLILESARARGIIATDPHVHDLRIGTIHSLCDSLLAEFDSEYMAAGTQLIDEVETHVHMTDAHRRVLPFLGPTDRDLVRRILDCEGLVDLFRAPWVDQATWPASTYDRVAVLLAALNQHVETWIPRCSVKASPNGVDLVHATTVTPDLVALQRRWETYLDSRHILDFSTLQKRFNERQSVLLDQVDHVFVDEFQDTNPIQLAIHTTWLERPSTRLTVVGDDEQSLYRFRGSDVDCFIGLEKDCAARHISFRIERLEKNWRSTRRIVEFTQAFRKVTVLDRVSMPKTVKAPGGAPIGVKPRLLEGPWNNVASSVAEEIDTLGAGRLVTIGSPTPPTAAILLFSTSEKNSHSPALALRRALEARGLRVHNPRNKTAGRQGPVVELFALISYLIDPVSMGQAGKNSRPIEVWASCGEAHKAGFALTEPPAFPISQGHVTIQKRVRKNNGGSIAATNPALKDAFEYIDDMRAALVKAATSHLAKGTQRPSLTIAGLVARLLTFPHFRNTGFTIDLFREALFTQLLESHVAPSRLTKSSLDQPLTPVISESYKVAWPNWCWSFLNLMGTTLQKDDLDDLDVEAFAEGAVGLLTFHQAKGLEFDHVYVGLTGRTPTLESALQTALFSGKRIPYALQAGHPVTKSKTMTELALADREREIYVAITRAKERLTVLVDPFDDGPFTSLNPGLRTLFSSTKERPYRRGSPVRVREWSA